MKLKFYSVILFVIFCVLANKPLFGQYHFQSTYGKPTPDKAFCVLVTSDGFVLSGQAAGSLTDFLIMKTDSAGNVLWSKTYGGAQNEEGRAIIQTPDRGFIMSGYTLSYGQGAYDAMLLKVDSMGVLQWQKSYGGASFDAFWPLALASDSAIFAGGWTQSFGAGGNDAMITKLNLNGDTLWNKTFGGSGDDYFRALAPTNDDGCIAVGETNSFGFGGGAGYDVLAVRLNSSGDTLWTKTFGHSTGEDYAWSVKQTSDGGFIVGGNSASFGAGSGTDDALLIRLDANGNLLWTKTYGNNYINTCRSICQNTAGEFVFCGYSGNSPGASGENGLIVKTDANGDTIWTRSFGGTDQEHFRFLNPLNALDYVLCGYTKSFGAGQEDIHLLTISENGFSALCHPINASLAVQTRVFNTSSQIASGSCNLSIAVHSSGTIQNYTENLLCDTILLGTAISAHQVKTHIYVYPNPVHETIQIQSGNKKINSIKLYDSTGSLVGDYVATEISLSAFIPGIYLLLVQCEETTYSIKIVKE